MTTDSDFIPMYEGHCPREYHYFMVKFKITHKTTGDSISFKLYFDMKYTFTHFEKLLKECRFNLPELLKLQMSVYEVRDSDDILFMHIKNSSQLQVKISSEILSTVLLHHWHYNIVEKIKKIFKKFITFLNNRLFIYRKAKIIV